MGCRQGAHVGPVRNYLGNQSANAVSPQTRQAIARMLMMAGISGSVRSPVIRQPVTGDHNKSSGDDGAIQCAVDSLRFRTSEIIPHQMGQKMARNGSGTFALTATMATPNAVSNSTTVNAVMEDVADVFTDSINKDGTKAFAANQSMGGNKLTSLASGTTTTDAANVSQVQAGRINWADAGGTADAITGTSPAPTALTDGDLFYVRAADANATIHRHSPRIAGH